MTRKNTLFAASLSLFALPIALSGCEPEVSIDEAEAARSWIEYGRPRAFYAVIEQPVERSYRELGLGELDLGAPTVHDAACPTVTRDGDAVILRGGCTTALGVAYVGEARAVPDSLEGFFHLTLDGYGWATESSSTLLTGEVTFSHAAELIAIHFEGTSEVVVGDGAPQITRYDYGFGRVDGRGEGPTSWTPSGEIESDRIGLVGGAWLDVTEREDDAACAGHPLSLEMTVQYRGHHYDVTLDEGACCEGEGVVRFRREGGPSGELPCSVL